MSAFQLIREETGGKKWIECRDGWISYVPVGTDSFYVRATKHRAMTVHGSELREVLNELITALGGRANNQFQ